MKRYYVDHAATTPLDASVLEHMIPFMKENFGNPSSMHTMGVYVKKAINDVRNDVASRFGVSFKDVIFTSGGTEATNLALRGLAAKYPERKEIITSTIEHHATIKTLEELKEKGFSIHFIDVDQEGFINLDQLSNVLSERTLLVTLIWANNEIGTIQDIETVGDMCKKFGVFLHVDAVQMVAHTKVNLKELPIDLLSCSAHKFYGPKGIGALIKKEHITLDPILYGGSQEMGYRSGTENVYGIIGFGEALKRNQEHLETENKRLNELSYKLLSIIQNECPEVLVNGSRNRFKRLPGLLSLSFPGVSSQDMAYTLDQKGVYVSTGSACLSNEILESHVLKAISVSKDYGTIRVSLGKENKMEDIDRIAKLIIETYHELIN